MLAGNKTKMMGRYRERRHIATKSEEIKTKNRAKALGTSNRLNELKYVPLENTCTAKCLSLLSVGGIGAFFRYCSRPMTAHATARRHREMTRWRLRILSGMSSETIAKRAREKYVL